MSQHEALLRRRYRRDPLRWQTEFGRWVGDYGVPRIAQALACDPDLRVTNRAVYEWLQGHPPGPTQAVALVELLGGRPGLEAIYEHGRAMRASSTLAARGVTPEGNAPNDH
jgi:hypothetical protein